MAELDVAIVSVEREIWSGKATFLFTRTISGEIGILPNHIPLVAQLVDDAMVRVEREGEDELAESAEFSSEIDADEAKADADSDDPQTAARGRARLRALGQID
jgi:F-type H+-transporting ATPase subunit epsilon